MDTLTRDERSERMSRVRSKGTKPEMTVRRLLHSLGIRYRLHASSLPGNPDIVLVSRKKVVFVHGCFWHRHPRCRNTRLPKSNLDFWKPKLEANRKRDIRNQKLLSKLGWRFLIVWECEVGKTERLTKKLVAFLGD